MHYAGVRGLADATEDFRIKQQCFVAACFENSEITRKAQILDEMEQIILWKELFEVIEPYYPNPKGTGRKLNRLERMLPIFL